MRAGARGPLLLFLAACSSAPAALLSPPTASTPSVASAVASSPSVASASPTTAPSAAPRREPDPALLALALGIVDAFQNEAPRPVLRGYGQIPHVLYRSDRRTPRQFSWFEAPEADLHGPVQPASSVVDCSRELLPSSSPSPTRDGPWLRRSPLGDALLLAPPGEAKLGLGAAHGACLVRERGEVWLGWSTPESPPELVAVRVSSGAVRPLRKDARPGLSQLGAVSVQQEGMDLLVLSPKDPRGAVVAVRPAPLARWDGWLRLLPEVGLLVVKTSHSAAQARSLATARTGQDAEEAEDPGAPEGASREELARAWVLHAEALATRSRSRESRGK